jgi:hypothetical protein
VSDPVDLAPLLSSDLVGADHIPYLVVEYLSGRSGERRETRALERPEELLDGQPRGLGALGYLESGERVDVHLWQGFLHRPQIGDVVVAGKGVMDPSLHAHLGGPTLPGFDRALGNLFRRQEVGRSAQVQ